MSRCQSQSFWELSFFCIPIPHFAFLQYAIFSSKPKARHWLTSRILTCRQKLVSRRSADDLRDFLHHHNPSVSGTKPLLEDRVVQFAIEKTEPALAEDIGDAVVEEVVPKELTEDALVRRIANISEGERDLLVGRFLRLLGGDHATQYGELLRAAIRADPP